MHHAPTSAAPKPPAGETLLDLKGLSCPLPVLRANRALRTMQPGERLRVLATDRAAVQDFHAFCRETGHALVAFGEEGGTYSFVLRRRPEPTAEVAAADEVANAGTGAAAHGTTNAAVDRAGSEPD